MKKILVLIIFSISTTLSANDDMTSVENIIRNSRPAQLPEVAGKLSALGSTYQIKGDYANALLNYKKSLQIRKSIGLDRTQGYATVLFLKSIVEHEQGDSCKATESIKTVISIYKYLGLNDDAKAAESEGLKEFNSACQVLLTHN